MKTYSTKTAATKAKKPGQTTYKRKDGTWACKWPKSHSKKEVNDGRNPEN